MATLVEYVWLEQVKESALRMRRKRVRAALDELAGLGWSIIEYARGKWQIGRPQWTEDDAPPAFQ